MELGNFSVSLAVKDLIKSREFYEKLGFRVIHGDNTKWVVMQDANATIGLFEGMFESNILTFNPGWNRKGENTDPFQDVRDIQRELKSQAIELQSEVDESTQGPAHVIFSDPDGNLIMIDQHR